MHPLLERRTLALIYLVRMPARCRLPWLNDQQPLLVMFLADGAGSVSQGGGEGAMLAVNEAMAYMSQKSAGWGNWGLMISSPRILC